MELVVVGRVMTTAQLSSLILAFLRVLKKAIEIRFIINQSLYLNSLIFVLASRVTPTAIERRQLFKRVALIAPLLTLPARAPAAPLPLSLPLITVQDLQSH